MYNFLLLSLLLFECEGLKEADSSAYILLFTTYVGRVLLLGVAYLHETRSGVF
jgi:hypothetical protein